MEDHENKWCESHRPVNQYRINNEPSGISLQFYYDLFFKNEANENTELSATSCL